MAKLPNPTVTAPPATNRPAPTRPHQLDRRLTDTERAAIIAGYKAGRSAKQLATEWQLAKASILTILRTGNANIRQQRRLSDDEIDHVVLSYNHSESLYRIGQRLGVAHTTVCTALQRRGVARRDTHGRPRYCPTEGFRVAPVLF
ncbi:hypothetical protein [Nocardia sp. CA-135398]|uniref:hypothetical protein n=1 Tax=Nocardia sp. CA-135398 TaxID=3239977 RepID=UPI003D99833E